MIGEKNVISNVCRATSVGIFGQEIMQLIADLRWLVMLSFVLIAADFWFGVSEAKMVGKDVRRSKAWRRTFNKVVDYMCYLMVAGVLGKAIAEPLGYDHMKFASVVMLLVCAWEIDSIYGHICVLKGVAKEFSLRKMIWSWIRVLTFRTTNTTDNEAKEEKVEE